MSSLSWSVAALVSVEDRFKCILECESWESDLDWLSAYVSLLCPCFTAVCCTAQSSSSLWVNGWSADLPARHQVGGVDTCTRSARTEKKRGKDNKVKNRLTAGLCQLQRWWLQCKVNYSAQ